MREEEYIMEKYLSKKYDKVLVRDEVFGHQKSRETWLREGDRNIKKF